MESSLCRGQDQEVSLVMIGRVAVQASTLAKVSRPLNLDIVRKESVDGEERSRSSDCLIVSWHQFSIWDNF